MGEQVNDEKGQERRPVLLINLIGQRDRDIQERLVSHLSQCDL
jgi:hypothetical protein